MSKFWDKLKEKTIQPRSAKKELARNITIGLDFGTSTTKCVINVNVLDDEQYYAIQFPTVQGDTFYYPTAIACHNGQLYFGDQAIQFHEEKIIYSSKMAIPCQGSWNDFSSPFMSKEEPGNFIFFPYGFSASELAILYISNVIRMVKEIISKSFPRYKIIYNLNMACPMDQLEKDYAQHACDMSNCDNKGNRTRDNYIEKCYNEISQYSLILSQYSKNPWDIDEAYRYINRVKKIELEGKQQSPTHIIPETLAAISSYIKHPGSNPGHYMAIDIGAGTTDISVFWYPCNNALDTTLCYYSSGSLHKGIDDILKAIRNYALFGNSFGEARDLLNSRKDTLSSFGTQIDTIVRSMMTHKNIVFGKAYDKECKLNKWGNKRNAKLKLLFYGGGTQNDELKTYFKIDPLWKNVLGPAIENSSPEMDQCRKKINMRGENDLSASEMQENSSLLLIAEGLALRMIDIPEYGIQKERIHTPPKQKSYNALVSEEYNLS